MWWPCSGDKSRVCLELGAPPDVVVLINRESGAKESLAAEGYRMHAVFTLTQLVQHLKELGQIDSKMFHSVMDFIEQASP